MYDIFAVSQTEFNKTRWKELKEKYPTAILCEHVNNFQDISKKSFTAMFWIVWDDIVLTGNLDLTEYKTTEWDDNYIHVFKNGVNYDGISLCPKNATITSQELHSRLYENKKEVDINASLPIQFDKFNIDTVEDYKYALDNSATDMFWAVWPEIEITDTEVFELYYSHHNSFDRGQNHAFLHQFRSDEQTYNGLHLMSKSAKVSNREIQYRFLINKKEHERIVSRHRVYDIVFISYSEPNADKNYASLLKKYPYAKRIDGVKGIHQAHIAAAKLCQTEMFWVVDGDSEVLDSFSFDYVVNRYDLDVVHVWQSINPINGLIYGYGGIKLLPTQMTILMDETVPDMTTSISNKFRVVPKISNITRFNTDEFNTWKSAFRECAKLASKTIDRQKEDETNARLQTWTTVGHGRDFGEYAIRGARAGMEFGLSDKPDLKLINDFNWLKQRFDSEV